MNISKQRIIILIAAIFGAIAAFLPWASLLGFSVSGIDGDGIITLIVFTVAGVISFIGERTKAMTNLKYGVVAAGIICVVLAVIAMINVNDIGGAFGASPSVGFGVYLTILAGIALIIVPFIKKIEELDEKK